MERRDSRQEVFRLPDPKEFCSISHMREIAPPSITPDILSTCGLESYSVDHCQCLSIFERPPTKACLWTGSLCPTLMQVG